VITHLENTIKRQEEECNPDMIKSTFAGLSSASDADRYLNELVNTRKAINRNTIICEKLKSGN